MRPEGQYLCPKPAPGNDTLRTPHAERAGKEISEVLGLLAGEDGKLQTKIGKKTFSGLARVCHRIIKLNERP